MTNSNRDHDDVAEAEKLAKRDSPETNVRAWLLDTPDATLCTLSAKSNLAGFPFGSVVPYALDEQGVPFILIAEIAAHTANLRADSRGSLLVREKGHSGDAQATWRITVMGTWQRVELDEGNMAKLWARYEAAVPAARSYERTHAFALWRMSDVRKVRYIAGFGKICWLPGTCLHYEQCSDSFGAPALAHMNKDHVENMREMCRGLYGESPENVEMIEVTSTGFFLRADTNLRWFGFDREVEEEGLRGSIIAVLKKAREHLSQIAAQVQ